MLSYGLLCNGREELAPRVMQEGVDMAKRLGYFQDLPNRDPDATEPSVNAEFRRASSHVAWGCFNWLVLYTRFYGGPGVDRPPSLPRPGDQATNLDTGHTYDPSQPTYMDRTFASLCNLRCIQSEVFAMCNNNGQPLEQAPLDAAEHKYHDLLQWARSLALSVSRREHNVPHHVVNLQ